MKFKKLIVSVAIACLMALLSVSTFAQTAQAQADPARVMPMFVAQTLRAGGLMVIRDGDILSVEQQIELRVPSTLQDWEESGIRARLVLQDQGARFVPQGESNTDAPPAEELARFRQFRQCLNTANFINQVRYTQCQLTLSDIGDLVCKVRTLLQHVFDDLDCIFTYICSPENNYCE